MAEEEVERDVAEKKKEDKFPSLVMDDKEEEEWRGGVFRWFLQSCPLSDSIGIAPQSRRRRKIRRRYKGKGLRRKRRRKIKEEEEEEEEDGV